MLRPVAPPPTQTICINQPVYFYPGAAEACSRRSPITWFCQKFEIGSDDLEEHECELNIKVLYHSISFFCHETNLCRYKTLKGLACLVNQL